MKGEHMTTTTPRPEPLRDPRPEELETPQFKAVWECIKKWDIGTPQDIDNGKQMYSFAMGNHVVAILDALEGKLSAT